MLAPHTTLLRPTLSLFVVGTLAIGPLPTAHANDGATGSSAAAPEPTPDGPAPTQPPGTDDAGPSSTIEPLPELEPMPQFEPTPAEPTPEAAPPSKAIETTPPKPTVPPPKPADAKTDEGADDEQVPQRLPPMQTAGWWTLFGGFAIGTVAGVLGGLAEREEDRAIRLSVRYDLTTNSQPQYQDIRSEYEQTLRKGHAEASAGIALAVVGLAAAVAGITVLAVAQARDRKAKRTVKGTTARHLDLRGGGLRVRF
jgi:hypothetical protein